MKTLKLMVTSVIFLVLFLRGSGCGSDAKTITFAETAEGKAFAACMDKCNRDCMADTLEWNKKKSDIDRVYNSDNIILPESELKQKLRDGEKADAYVKCTLLYYDRLNEIHRCQQECVNDLLGRKSK